MLDYILDQFSQIYRVDNPGEVVGFMGSGKPVEIRSQAASFFEGSTPHPNSIDWAEWKDQKIPALFGAPDGDMIRKEADRVVVEMDVIAGSFYFLSSWQEVHDDRPDKFGRFQYTSSIQHQLGIPHLPVVNYYLDILKTAIEQATQQSIEFRHWNDHPFAIFLSHDLDKLQSGWKEGGFSEVKKGRVFSPFKLVGKRLSGSDTWFNIDDILSLEEQYGFHSTLFFLPVKGRTHGISNADYDISSEKMQHIIRQVNDSSWEVGVHGAYGSAFTDGELPEQMAKFPSTVITNRFHFLSWQPEKTASILEDAAIDFDCTLGFAEEIGFRHGIAHPFQPYLLDQKRKAAFTEVPLHVMDTTLREPQYKNESAGNVHRLVQPVIDEVEKFKGCLSILWHNNYLSEYKYAGWREAYQSLLLEAKKRGATSVTPGDKQGFWN